MQDTVTPKAQTQESSKRTVFIVIIFILLATNSLLLWQYFDKKQNLAEVSKSLQITKMDKDQLAAELQKVKADYDKLNSENTALQNQLTVKDEEIQSKIAQIQKLIASGDAESLKKAKLEIAELKNMNVRYAMEMDSMKHVNQQLFTQNQTLNTNLTEVKGEINDLTQKNSVLAGKVAVGSILKSRDLAAIAVKYKRSGKEIQVSRASSAEKVKLCFTILENAVIDPGYKDVYIRILSPDGAVMSTSQETFLVNGQQSLYSLKENIDYQNKDTDLCFYYIKTTGFSKGKYDVEVYSNNQQIGATTFTLK
ncbi:MAG: hypothetical protein ABI723_14250 [Bacteroidia bacterium]